MASFPLATRSAFGSPTSTGEALVNDLHKSPRGWVIALPGMIIEPSARGAVVGRLEDEGCSRRNPPRPAEVTRAVALAPENGGLLRLGRA